MRLKMRAARLGLTRTWWSVLGLALALAGATALLLLHLRNDAIQGQSREIKLLSAALADELDRGLQGAEVGLQALQAELADGVLSPGSPESGAALHTRADLMPLVSALWLVDDQARLLSASDPGPSPPFSAFPVPLEQVQGLARGQIQFSGLVQQPAPQAALVVLALRFTTPHQGASGWILAGIPAELLLGSFPAALPSDDARLAVFAVDGSLLAGRWSLTDPAGLSARALLNAQLPPGTARVALWRDGEGVASLAGLRRLPRHGLMLVLSRDLSSVLAPWQESARFGVGGLALLLLMLVLSVALVERANRRHVQAEAALQAQRARAGKLESLGTLAGGVAHDFNNILAAIIGFGEMAEDQVPAGTPTARHIGKVLQAAQRGKALVERILAFSRGAPRSALVFELAPLADEALDMLAQSLRPGIVLEREFHAPGARIKGDPAQAFEAVMNLCTNAMQSMSGAGTLRLQIARLPVAAARTVSHGLLAPGTYLELSVEDQGVGIAPEVMERLFEPFFTTRRAQSGTGLGLAVVHSVVSDFGGAVDVSSRVGQGSCFRLYFPECSLPLTAEPLAAESLPRGQGQRLMVVDDRAELVALSVETLQGLGYRCEGWTEPQEAHAAFLAEPEAYAALITDEMMPGLSGIELATAVRAVAPQLPVLLVSGYGGAGLSARAAAAGVFRVLGKPLQRAELARALAEALASVEA